MKHSYICIITLKQQLKQGIMTTINFQEIRDQIIEKGLMRREDAETAWSQISITGEFTRSGDIYIENTYAGLAGKGLSFKGLKTEVELPEVVIFDTDEETEEAFKASIEAMYPGVVISVRID